MKPQKTIRIAVVDNGYLVYPHVEQPTAMYAEAFAVFNSLADLQAQLPELLERPRTGPAGATPIEKVVAAPEIHEYASLLKWGIFPSLKDRACIIRDRGFEGSIESYWLAPQKGSTRDKSLAHRYTVQSAFDWLGKVIGKGLPAASSDRPEKYSLELI